jgi:hypothetical protein
MALTKCQECGGQVSTQAASCPHCGYAFVPPAVQRPDDSPELLELKKQTQMMADSLLGPAPYTSAFIGGIIIGLAVGIFGAVFMQGTSLEPMAPFVLIGAPIVLPILGVIGAYRERHKS